MRKMNTLDEIQRIVSLYVSIPEDSDIKSLRLMEDLGIVGDDAEELLDCVSDTFSIDMSEFIFSDYFPTEASSEMYYYLARRNYSTSKNTIKKLFYYFDGLFWAFISTKRGYKSITINDLSLAAMSGKWLKTRYPENELSGHPS